MVAVLNFAPYAGAAASVIVLTLVGVTTFPDLAQALLLPASFLAVTTIEGQLVTPTTRFAKKRPSISARPSARSSDVSG